MSLTRVTLDTILIARTGSLLTTVDKDGTTADGTNQDLVDPIRSALRLLGYTVASVASVADSDLASVSLDDEEALIDLAELKILDTIVYPGATILVDISVGPRRESLSQFSKHISEMIERKTAAINDSYGAITGDALSAGVFSVASLEDGDNVY